MMGVQMQVIIRLYKQMLVFILIVSTNSAAVRYKEPSVMEPGVGSTRHQNNVDARNE